MKPSLIVFTVFILVHFCNSQDSRRITMEYTGQDEYPIRRNAILTCNFMPIPDDLNAITVAWFKTKPSGGSIKIGLSSIGATYVYINAPAELKNRFTMSHSRFDIGLAEATIQNIMIDDESNYECEVDDNTRYVSYRAEFSLRVYSEPTVVIKDIEVNLDVSPHPNASPEEDTVTIAKCYAVNAYPEPIRLEFTSSGSGNLWIVEQAEFLSRTQNPDGTFDVSARLRIQPTPELDGDTISCVSVIIDSQHTTSSGNTTSEITVNDKSPRLSVINS